MNLLALPSNASRAQARTGERLRAFDQRTERPRAEVPSVEVDGRTATLRLYDPVDSYGEWRGVSAKEFAQAIDELPSKVEEIRIHINSPGGDVFDGIAIVNVLRSHDAKVVAIIDGIAASAASFIACAADETLMAPNSELMIHDAWGVCVGNAAEMRSMAEMLDKVSDNIATIYAAKAGGDLAAWRTAMGTESWYSAEEAVAAGLADAIAEPATDQAAAKARFDLSIFTFAGREDAPAPAAPIAEPPTAADTPPDPGPASAISAQRIAEYRHLVASTRT